MRKLVIAIISSILLFKASPSNATVFDILEVQNGSHSGFGYTLFHSSSRRNPMSGRILARAADSTNQPASIGTYNDVSGAIDFSFNLVSSIGGLDYGSVHGYGNLLFSNSPIGTITLDFTDGADGGLSSHDGSVLTFLQRTFTDGDSIFDPNSFVEDPLNSGMWLMSLWGANGYKEKIKRNGKKIGWYKRPSIGADLRFKLSPVPLPAAIWLFLAAIGGIGIFGWKRNNN